MLYNSDILSTNIYVFNTFGGLGFTKQLWDFFQALLNPYLLGDSITNYIVKAYIPPFRISSPEWTETNTILFGLGSKEFDNYDLYKLRQFNRSNLYSDPIAVYTFPSSLSDSIFTQSYLDYPTITEYMLHLPFFGYVNIDYIYIKKGFRVEYYFNYSTADMVCNIISNNERVYNYNINVGTTVHFSGGDGSKLGSLMANLLSTVISAGVGTALPTTAQTTSSTLTNVLKSGGGINTTSKSTTRNPITNRQITDSTKSFKSTTDDTTVNIDKTSSSKRVYDNTGVKIGNIINAIGNLSNMRMPATNVGTSTNEYSINFYNKCFLKIRRPFRMESTYNNLKMYQGRPTKATYRLEQCNGYVQVGMIHLNIKAPFSELEEIDDLLHSGVIINNPTALEIVIENAETQTVEV